jgi:hypothetical protein
MTTAIERASKDFMQAGHHYGATLYELDAQAEAILFMLDSAESDEERESLLAELNLNEMLVQGKVESYLAVISSLEHLAEGRTAAAKRMRQRAEMPQNAAQRLRERLLEHMQRSGQNRIETQQFTVRRQMNPPSAEVYDETLVPGGFKEIRTEIHVDKRAIISHVKATGETVPGVTVSQREGIRVQ